jgi:hypothetical protein
VARDLISPGWRPIRLGSEVLQNLGEGFCVCLLRIRRDDFGARWLQGVFACRAGMTPPNGARGALFDESDAALKVVTARRM